MTLYLTPKQVLFIHVRLIPEPGGEPGLRDLSVLVDAVERPKLEENGQEVYPGCIKNQPSFWMAFSKKGLLMAVI